MRWLGRTVRETALTRYNEYSHVVHSLYHVPIRTLRDGRAPRNPAEASGEPVALEDLGGPALPQLGPTRLDGVAVRGHPAGLPDLVRVQRPGDVGVAAAPCLEQPHV